MDSESFSEKIGNEKFRVGVIALLFLGIFVFTVGVGFFFFGNSKSDDDIRIITEGGDIEGEIVVHVDGAVNAPGVYKILKNSRVSDAVNSAGGLTSEADSGKINLAAKVSDGQKIYVVKNGENASGAVAGVNTGGAINVNNASSSELESLPGVGVVTAGKIIAGRPYNSIEEMVTKRAVSKSVLEKIKDLVTIY